MRKVRDMEIRTYARLGNFLLGFALLTAGPARAAVICVTTACDASCTTTAATIQDGIDAAVALDTVLVCPGSSSR
jgi:hypothetical protein